ncbi:MAG TPA: efflux RND transporter periplasmic adaptor subunit [Chitinophagaceae bacterium]|nr:efflux RND transporter periplasmic adaptor subunit [Chitinophagaceae bacterium]
MKQILYLCLAVLTICGCRNSQKQNDHSGDAGIRYTCPMPEDSVFSDKPGKCPKCGMQLVPATQTYTCPMPEDSVFSDKPGKCPKCGMDLVTAGEQMPEEDLEVLLRPTNEFVLSGIPVVALRAEQKDITVDALGIVEYDTRQTGSISANISGRIEKLYVRYRFQKIEAGQKIMDVYSPELMYAQENLLFLIRNDPSNQVMIDAAKQKLLLLGMSGEQLNSVVRKGKPDFAVSIYSRYRGHIHESGLSPDMGSVSAPMETSMGDAASLTTMELKLKEGMYVDKGQTVFTVYNRDKAWVAVNIFPEDAALVTKGQAVQITPEAASGQQFAGTVDFIEPFFREGTKTQTARIYFNNSGMKLPVGSQVKATLSVGKKSGEWLPEAAVVSLGLHQVVFKKVAGGFIATKVITGIKSDNEVVILEGLTQTDSVAVNAQYLTDSESFIKIKN